MRVTSGAVPVLAADAPRDRGRERALAAGGAADEGGGVAGTASSYARSPAACSPTISRRAMNGHSATTTRQAGMVRRVTGADRGGGRASAAVSFWRVQENTTIRDLEQMIRRSAHGRRQGRAGASCRRAEVSPGVVNVNRKLCRQTPPRGRREVAASRSKSEPVSHVNPRRTRRRRERDGAGRAHLALQEKTRADAAVKLSPRPVSGRGRAETFALFRSSITAGRRRNPGEAGRKLSLHS